MAMCGSLQFKALLWLNDTEELVNRTQSQIKKLTLLAQHLPRDVLQTQFHLAKDDAVRIASDAVETRWRYASFLMIAEQLQKQEIRGQAYLEAVENEQEQPFLILPHV